MPEFKALDGTVLSYREVGDGDPLICLPGGPMQDSRYLGELGGLSSRRRLVLLDLRGTGLSPAPADPSTYRCDRQVDDVEALRAHLGLPRIDLLGHSAGANLATSYAARFPHRIARLLLITPSLAALDISVSTTERRSIALLRTEPWSHAAVEALDRLASGEGTDDDASAIEPLFYGRWDDRAKAHCAARDERTNAEAAALFGSEGAYDALELRTAIARLPIRSLVIAGERDLNSPPTAVARLAALFPHPTLVELSGCAHFPWLDEDEAFVRTVDAFLS